MPSQLIEGGWEFTIWVVIGILAASALSYAGDSLKTASLQNKLSQIAECLRDDIVIAYRRKAIIPYRLPILESYYEIEVHTGSLVVHYEDRVLSYPLEVPVQRAVLRGGSSFFIDGTGLVVVFRES